MTPERWKQIDQLLEAALGIEPDNRAAFLDESCAGDSELRQRVDALLAAMDESESFMETPPTEAAETLITPTKGLGVGQSVAHYEITGKLGAGGMGEVYLAWDRGLGRRVALKLLPDHFTRDADRVRRFELEARAVSALNHPNILTIYDIGRGGAIQFLATEYVDGQTFRQKLSKGPMSLSEALDTILQVASALEAAHAAGIIHRDIKPENLMSRPDGLVKVLDFGLAKLAEVSGGLKQESIKEQKEGAHFASTLPLHHAFPLPLITDPGTVLGTAQYMSPEQARGQEVDPRSDIFSLGVVLHEMITGRAPFEGESVADVLAAILKNEPPPLARFATDVPAELQGIVDKSLRKDRDERYQTVKDFSIDLKNLKKRLEIHSELNRAARPETKDEGRTAQIAATTQASKVADTGKVRISTPYSAFRIGFVLVALILLAAAVFTYRRYVALTAARESLPRVKELAGQQNYFDAYDLALKLRERLPDDTSLEGLMPEISDDLSVQTEPAGATVYLKRSAPESAGKSPARELAGTTPIAHLRIARGEYVLEVEKDGYAPAARTISSALNRAESVLGVSPAIRVNMKLIEAGKAPNRMVFVPGGNYALVGWGQPSQESAKLGDYFIDKFEVSNREFKEFIQANGYLKKELWKFPFVKDGKKLSWEEAIEQFKDRTGLPGPRDWVSGDFHEGADEYPVTGLTWYEAAAYAEFRGKHLPTVFQWEKAARDGSFTHTNALVMPWGLITGQTAGRHANLQGRGVVAVDQFEFGVSPYGCYNMAGNVTEWCFNKWGEDFTALGGSWRDPVYTFADYGRYPGFYSSDRVGFRCVLNPKSDQEGQAAQGGMSFTDDETQPIYAPSSEANFKAWLSHYRYDKTPLDAQVVETTETDEFRREKITYNGANDERVIVYLYLPKNAQKPYQVINYVPGGGCFYSGSRPTEGLEFGFFSSHIKLGRAVLVSIYKGCGERFWPVEQRPTDKKSVKYRDRIVSLSTDVRRGLDYLGTRTDIDTSKVALMNISTSFQGLILGAVEPRYRSAIFAGYGVYKSQLNNIPEANPINFAPHIRTPKLILNGRYDEDFPLKAAAEPLYRLLREPKRLELYDGGHLPPPEISVPVINRWLDETLGPVRHK